MIRVLFVVPHPVEGPSSRFRVYQYLPYLRANGVQADVHPFVSSQHAHALFLSGRLSHKLALTAMASLGRVRDVVLATRYDVVYVLREAFPFGPPFFENALSFASGALIFDFDDSIWMPSTAHYNPLDRLRDWGKPAKLVARAQHVVAGSQYLAEFARRHASNKTGISIIPTVVDDGTYVPCPGRTCRDAKVVIGWVGTPRGSKAFLQSLLPVMRDFSVRYPHVLWRFVGAEPFETEGLPIEFKPWTLANEVGDVQSFDIGLMPLTDDEYTRGKCGFKLIQYMSCGLPVVCTPVGANCDIVEDGICGYFASTVVEWSAALMRLVDEPALRRSMGMNGRRLVEQRYSVIAQGPRLLALLHAVGASSTPAYRQKRQTLTEPKSSPAVGVPSDLDERNPFPTAVSRARIALKLAIKLLLGIASWPLFGWHRQDGMRVLYYHRVNPYPFAQLGPVSRELTVSPAAFERQISWLNKHGYRNVEPQEIEAILAGHKQPDPRSVLITFDDGFEDNFLWAHPILAKYGFRGVFFMITSYAGAEHGPDRASRDMPGYGRLLGWDQMRRMHTEGALIGSHSCSHPMLNNVNDQSLVHELTASRTTLTQALGPDADWFAYPAGHQDERVRQAVAEAGYRVAFTTIPGTVGKHTAPLQVPRTEISVSDSMLVFRIKMSGALDWLRIKEAPAFRRRVEKFNAFLIRHLIRDSSKG